MQEGLRIRLADWRDREVIHPIRRLITRPMDGGLYELLNWPIYHVHVAAQDGRTVGFTSCILYGNGTADDAGTVVVPEFRRHRIASELRATQLRDLGVMGWTHLYCAVPADSVEGLRMAHEHFGEPLGEVSVDSFPPHLYYCSRVEQMYAKILDRGVRAPHPLSPKFIEALRLKAGKARADLQRLAVNQAFQLQKADLRSQSIG